MSDLVSIDIKTSESSTFDDLDINCIDCRATFVWTAGEQSFFHDKRLENPPKRCKPCKKAKNQRLEAIEIGRVMGKRQRIEVSIECVTCQKPTTVPFFPSQGRPVYCRECFQLNKGTQANGAESGA